MKLPEILPSASTMLERELRPMMSSAMRTGYARTNARSK
ncbi:hypothetical protein ALTERO38_51139 [Alteromonas sp. 38]|nr:hypothetical protein ALTER154_70320 [Alteromonas sp. 154]VXB62031.1 hypothetical protein ALTERO38_51139 [Alteromonas sp. 38]